MINEFLTLRTNQRSDQWGGDYRNRMRFAVEVVRAVRERVGNDFIIILERGTLAPGDFMDEIAAMLRELVETCRPVWFHLP